MKHNVIGRKNSYGEKLLVGNSDVSEWLLMAGSPYTTAEYNYQNAFQNLVWDVNWNNCLSIHFGNSIFA